jgi:hypothetical protein
MSLSDQFARLTGHCSPKAVSSFNPFTRRTLLNVLDRVQEEFPRSVKKYTFEEKKRHKFLDPAKINSVLRSNAKRDREHNKKTTEV